MNTPRLGWGGAGVVAGLAGLAVSYGATQFLGRRLSPFDAVAEMVVEHTPGAVSHWVIERVGSLDKLLLGAIILVALLLFMLSAGRLAAHSWWAPIPLHVGVGLFALLAVTTRFETTRADLVPVAAGVVTWIVALSLLTDPLRAELAAAEAPDPERLPYSAETRRTMLIRLGVVGVAGAFAAVGGTVFSKGRREVERLRRLLNLPVTSPNPPAATSLGLDGVTPWQTPTSEFYRIDTVFQAPAIRPSQWQLRIHGLVERELVISYQDLIDKRITEDWITLSCVSNPVGGDLVGNAWWSGVRVARLLKDAGVQEGADAVLQTSYDGWTCGTPLEALTDDRNAMIAIAMNGKPLDLDHGFPARTIVPGLYGYVSACKWVIDLEVTRFADIEAYWIERGWSEQGPVKITSRVDVPGDGDEVEAGQVRIGGMAWAQHTGIAGVEVAVDGGGWQPAEIGSSARHRDGNPNRDTWVQWAATVDVDKGDHEVRVRAIGVDGEVQTSVEREVNPDGATGWHTRKFSAS